MTKYKKIVPYLFAATAPLVLSCNHDTTEFKDVVVAKQNGVLYLDRNSDGNAEACINFSADSTYNAFYQYAIPGDTLTYHCLPLARHDQRILRAYSVEMSRINSYSTRELETIQEINKLRAEIGQPKTRSL